MKISVLVPVYKVEKYIARCVESIFSQEYDDLEFVFVNDCTPDNSIDILKIIVEEKYPALLSRVKIINHEKNRGSAAARNTALDNATGDFITWVDADDWLAKDAIKTLAEKQNETDADIVTGWSYEVLTDKNKPFLQPKYQTPDEMLDCMWEHTWNHVLWGRLIRKNLYELANNRCEEGCNQGEDYWLMLPVIYSSKKIAVVEKYVYYYNRTNESAQCFNLGIMEGKGKRAQDQENHFKAVVFFLDKEDHYKKKACESAIKYLQKKTLHNAAKYNDKQLFNETLATIKTHYQDYFYAIKFNNTFYRLFFSNIHLYGSFLRIRSYVWRNVVKPVVEK